jgi:hypothetical protein
VCAACAPPARKGWTTRGGLEARAPGGRNMTGDAQQRAVCRQRAAALWQARAVEGRMTQSRRGMRQAPTPGGRRAAALRNDTEPG